MTDFRENVIDILDEWGGYSTLPCGQPSINSGQVEIKCFINNVCPFYKTPYKEDTLVFNSETFRELEKYLPEMVSNAIDTTSGLEGLHFKYRKVFRHNYINKWRPNVSSAYYNPNADADEVFANFEVYYNNVSINNRAVVVGADKTRYRKEHDWAIVSSVFDNLSCRQGEVEECGITAYWDYANQAVPSNRMTDLDIYYDYPKYYWENYLNSYEVVNGISVLKPGSIQTISKYNVQMPIQTNLHSQSANGVHWRVLKRTPVFQGADFFIRFYKRANESISYNNLRGNVQFNDDYYKPLDFTNNDRVFVGMDATANVSGFSQFSLDNKFSKYSNEAVRSSGGQNGEEPQSNIYDFYTQAYYIIELQREYFIVIPARGNPTFIHFFSGDNVYGTISKKLGKPFDKITGLQLMNADHFDVVVRNHLGKLVIQFEGPGINVPPWIISRFDWALDPISNDDGSFYFEEKVRDIFVPKGRIAIWGGNIMCGFLFGFLQYESGGCVSFVYPPAVASLASGDDLYSSTKAFENFGTSEIGLSSDYFRSQPLWLPLNGEGDGSRTSHNLMFEAYRGPKLDNGSIGDQPTEFNNVPLFTQDAQYYRNHYDQSVRGNLERYEVGYFYYNKPIKEFSPPVGNIPVKTSNIIIKKYKYLNYYKIRHQAFNVYFGMMCGDHFFNDAYYENYWRLYPIQNVNHSIVPTTEDIGNSGWYIPDCKTPILTSVRLTSDPSPEPRWDDGTSITDGINRDPESGSSSYFIDASDHVMNFSHSWTSSNFSSLEHSGTINFYLNHDMTAEHLDNPEISINNVTADLFALQDKTFYIEIWAGYKDRSVMSGASLGGVKADQTTPCDHSNYTRIPGFYKMFTGLCLGGSISYEYGKTVMTCKIEDYNVVLKGMRFFNSPWFDGMKDSVAINEILRMAGFRDQGTYDPATLIRELANGAISGDSQLYHQHFDGRNFKFENFGLPSGYSRLDQPALKFNEGDPLIDAVSKITDYSAKLFYFDEWGIAHYEDYRDLVEQDFQGNLSLIPLYQFTTNPEIISGQLLFNKVERSFDVNSVYNHLKFLTNTPDMHLLIRDRIKWESFENPESSGFLGYQKTFYQTESMFGSKVAQMSAMNKYSVAFKPIVSVKFETFGLPLRATDIISVEGEIVRVIKVDHQFDAEKNLWWMNVECQRFQAINASDILPVSSSE